MNQKYSHMQSICLLRDLNPFPKNSRTHSDAQIAQIAQSITEYGFTNPVLIDEDNTIVAGHGRVLAATKLGITELPCIILQGLSEAQRRAYVIADNKLALNAGWDIDILLSEIQLLKDDSFDIEMTGFSLDELDTLTPQVIAVGLIDDDAVPDAPSEPITKPGDVWLLGNHRLMCGDSTSIDEVDKLMNGIKSDMVFTDPPYGINEETDRDFASRTRLAKGNKFSKIIGDDSIDTALAAYSICETLSDIICYWGGNYYAHKIPASACWLIWDKRIEEKQRDMNSDCEIAYVKHPTKKSVRIFRHLWKGMIKGSEHGEGRVHPTQKPIQLAEWCFNELNPKGKTVLDLFGGSGSTLIACEKTGRHCYMMELDPKYCDVIVKRWEQFTSKKAVLDEI
ncbi:DNA methylase N-4/N-6 [uncultured Caudovirales phage]|uniref:DNA methylase N-4/N-6 n=1 Tax=uncultured Caudovirales phage TaxID=2100421 RepID=A0A6J5L521_9CAUD|nr:DNA methylase N-4/N-6 [uncultured Caudovirales phage]